MIFSRTLLFALTFGFFVLGQTVIPLIERFVPPSDEGPLIFFLKYGSCLLSYAGSATSLIVFTISFLTHLPTVQKIIATIERKFDKRATVCVMWYVTFFSILGTLVVLLGFICVFDTSTLFFDYDLLAVAWLLGVVLLIFGAKNKKWHLCLYSLGALAITGVVTEIVTREQTWKDVFSIFASEMGAVAIIVGITLVPISIFTLIIILLRSRLDPDAFEELAADLCPQIYENGYF